jgi:Protein of unknown function (DUF4231)
MLEPCNVLKIHAALVWHQKLTDELPGGPPRALNPASAQPRRTNRDPEFDHFVMNTPEPDYLVRRLDVQKDWHSKNARFNKQWYLVLEITTMAAGACIPIVNVLPANDGTVWQRVASAVLAGLVVFAAGVSKLFKFQETWLRYRAVAENLERERELFVAGVGDYDNADPKKRLCSLVDRVELLLADQTAQFLASQRTAREPPDAGSAETQ